MDTQGGGRELAVGGGLGPEIRLGGALRSATKRAIKGYLAAAEVAALARENLADVYAEAKHERAAAKGAAPEGPLPSAAPVGAEPEPIREGATPVRAQPLPRRGARLVGAVLGRARRLAP